MSQSIYGRIMNYRIGIRTQESHECLIQFSSIDNKEAGKLIGQKVMWKGEKNSIGGKIVGLHGKNGVVIAKFKKGLPGQAIGTTLELIRLKA
ncbi:MAG TPA: 50S ribosomal protein L35ae [Candidatus Nanoarchaeia archaeon]|nr:50S ribosomal protein L35ae [Candidatus Nanoarchaeia archaeon]